MTERYVTASTEVLRHPTSIAQTEERRSGSRKRLFGLRILARHHPQDSAGIVLDTAQDHCGQE